MISASKNSEKRPASLRAARLDREPEAQARADWLKRAAAKLCSVFTTQIPVGFEDETGFHSDVLWTQEQRLQTTDPNNVKTDKF